MVQTFPMVPDWLHPALGVVLAGLAFAVRGLAGRRGLLRRGVSMLDRIEGWRITLIGLTLVGLGLGWFWELRWLVVLSLGIGYVELQEASMVLRAWCAGVAVSRRRAADTSS